MAGVDQPLQPVGSAVGVVGRPQVDPVVAPSAAAGELDDGKQLDGGDTEGDEVVEVGDGAVERALGRERAHVQLVEDRGRQVDARPSLVRPREGRVVDEPGRALDAEGLVRRPGVGPHGAAVDREGVVVARSETGHVAGPLPPLAAGEGHPPPAGDDVDRVARPRRPHRDLHACRIASGHGVRSSRATGKAARRSARGTAAPAPSDAGISQVAAVTTSVQRPGGSATVVSPHPPPPPGPAPAGGRRPPPPAHHECSPATRVPDHVRRRGAGERHRHVGPAVTRPEHRRQPAAQVQRLAHHAQLGRARVVGVGERGAQVGGRQRAHRVQQRSAPVEVDGPAVVGVDQAEVPQLGRPGRCRARPAPPAGAAPGPAR